MRLYLDTNILVYMLMGQTDYLCREISVMLTDYSNVLYTSSVCVSEFIHLRQIGKISDDSREYEADGDNLVDMLDSIGIKMAPVTSHNLQELERLPMVVDHRDPADRLIIAQAISDRATLVSSDRKFRLYERLGLRFVLNER